MSGKPCIRQATEDDAEAITRLVLDHAVEEREQSPLTPAYVRRYLAAAGNGILWAERDGSPVALLSYSLRPDLYHAAEVCLIEELIVTAAERGRGLGGALLSALTERLDRESCAELSVAVMPGNARAVRFYQERGLREEALLLERHFPPSS